jgi:hypothetical protein
MGREPGSRYLLVGTDQDAERKHVHLYLQGNMY